ncbi:hypothetical protein [Caldovatus aquaticus]|uniref:Uncharacterized protein n=1 Tax=Caldovatus aquaticus TaxID=2865671 RepID=A0ABS7EZB6_9PROT|nr:hypothetical protein [Caldovatus aquaticus]MBW8268707.1 hypothetical protein [Caldovatus aquaticus]
MVRAKLAGALFGLALPVALAMPAAARSGLPGPSVPAAPGPAPVSEQTLRAGAFRIADIPVYCGPVPTVVVPRLGDLAQASPRPTQILLHPAFFEQDPLVQFFVYGHQCAHVNGVKAEAQADCAAIRLGLAMGWFTADTLPYLLEELERGVPGWTHSPGPQRVRAILPCAHARPPR